MFVDPNDACANGNQFPAIPRYVVDTTPLPLMPETKVFEDIELTIPFEGNFQWYFVLTTNQSIQIGEKGRVMEVVQC
jgi:hypothetical protein